MASVLGGEEAAALGLGEPAPDAVRLAHAQRELEAVVEHGTVEADAFGTPFARLTFFPSLRKRRWKEQL